MGELPTEELELEEISYFPYNKVKALTFQEVKENSQLNKQDFNIRGTWNSWIELHLTKQPNKT